MKTKQQKEAEELARNISDRDMAEWQAKAGIETINHKEKAEAYVRSKIPELMELSFGCLLVIQTEGYNDEIVSFLNETGNWWNVVDEKGHQFSVPKESPKIIGHPIQLQHWTWALMNRVKWEEGQYEFWSEWYPNQLEMHFSTEESDYVVVLSFTTGQPATEADYKAFNEIVGNL